MNHPKKQPVAAAAAGMVATPYTDPGDRTEDVVNSSGGAAIRALDRKLTDGLNLVHGQFAILRDERREDRQEFREFRNEMLEDRKELRNEMREGRAELRAEIANVDKRAEERAREQNERLGAVETRIGGLETATLGLTGQVSTALERGRGSRRLVFGVLGALGLLVAGGMIRPLAERVVSSLLGG